MIYIISGSGKVMVDGKVEAVNAGCAVHTGAEEMKVVCFFARLRS